MGWIKVIYTQWLQGVLAGKPLLNSFTMGYKSNDSCLKKVADDEPIFVLRAQDRSASKVVIHWIAKNFDTAPDEKLREAFEHALKMKNYQVHKNAD